MREIKILTPVGMLGYGFPEEDYRRGLEREPDAAILDSGSTDPGPYMLGTGTTMVKPRAYVRDLKVILEGIGDKKIPLLIGSAGGAGFDGNVDYIVDTIKDLCGKLGLHKKIVKIYADIPKELVAEKLKAGKISSCSCSPELTERDVEESIRIVAQMGMEPILKALNENPDADIIVAGRAYDPSPYAAFCAYKGITDPGIYWHMGKIMECGAFCCEKKGQVILATVREDSFDLPPMSPDQAQARSEKTARLIAAEVMAGIKTEKKPPENPVNAAENKAWPKIAARKAKSFRITDACIGCGQCKNLCPRQISA